MLKRFVFLCFILPIAITTFAESLGLLIGDSNSKQGQDEYLRAFLCEIPSVRFIYDTVNNKASDTILNNYHSFIGQYDFDWIILNFGTHDAFHGISGAAYEINACKIADSLHNAGKRVIFCLTTPIDDAVFGEGCNARVDTFNLIIPRVFDSIFGPDSFYYVDQNTFQKNNSIDLPIIDGVHYNTYKYSMFAAHTMDIIKAIPFFNALLLQAAESYEYSGAGLDAPDNNEYPDTVGSYEYSSAGLAANDLLGDTLTTDHLTFTNPDTTYFTYPVYCDSFTIALSAGPIVARSNGKWSLTTCNPYLSYTGWTYTLPPITYSLTPDTCNCNGPLVLRSNDSLYVAAGKKVLVEDSISFHADAGIGAGAGAKILSTPGDTLWCRMNGHNELPIIKRGSVIKWR